MRQQFNTGQEIVSEDLNTLQSRLERGIYDRIIYEILGRKNNAFFQDGLKVFYQSATSLVVKAGLGFQLQDTGTKEPKRKPIARDADVNVNIDTPDSSNNRIDIISVRTNRYLAETENRKFKDEFSDTITTQPFTVANDWLADVLYTAGTPSGSPAVPSTPAGYVKVAEILVSASTGIANQAAITDSRTLMPIAVSTTATGSSEYDAIVGVVGLDQGATYNDLKSALDNASDGWKILVLRSETINAVPVVLNNNIEIVFKKNVTFTKGSAIRGLQVDGDDCKIVNGRFINFITAGDSGIRVSASAARTVINAPRFLNNATNVDDLGTMTYVDIELQE
jgi:predicted outer membrane repeat protein